jgi:phosphoserine phosphatase RsbU/P
VAFPARMKERSFFVSVPADSRFLRSIRAFFQPLLTEAFGDATTQMLILALDEACSNVVKHSVQGDSDRRIAVSSRLTGDGVSFRLEDYCAQADVPNIKPRDLDVPAPGGLGTHFMTKIMDRIQFEPDPRHPERVALVMAKGFSADHGSPHET